ncbi:MAG: TerD family protein [Clostridia bacterium]|nr:TerD family protein [Clostridia bacterium]
MAINLSKGQRVSLEKSMRYVLVGLGWDTNRYDGGYDFDLDASVFMLGVNGKLLRDEDFVFYNNLVGRDGAVTHTGDNRTGEGEGDDEQIIIDLEKIPAEIDKIAVVVTIHEADIRHQNFGQVDNAYIRLAKLASPDDMVGEEYLRFDLVEDFSIETAIVVAEIYRRGGDWKFNPIAAGYQGGLAAICRSFGANV